MAQRKPGQNGRKRIARRGKSAAEKDVDAIPDPHRAIELVLQLMAIPGKSGEEGAVADEVERRLRDAGAQVSMIRRDAVPRQTPVRGTTGNLILKLPGTVRGPRRMFSAHLDTVPICVGSRPVVKKRMVRSANPATGLGADDRAGVATILTAAVELLERDLPHPPLTFCWFVQEEIGLQGSRLVNVKKLGQPKLAFNWDGGAPDKLTVGATGGCRITIDITGVASHAGVAPERGVSAITIAGMAIADLQHNGWLGLVQKGRKEGTSNVGVIQGGDATNVVTDKVLVRARREVTTRLFGTASWQRLKRHSCGRRRKLRMWQVPRVMSISRPERITSHFCSPPTNRVCWRRRRLSGQWDANQCGQWPTVA